MFFIMMLYFIILIMLFTPLPCYWCNQITCSAFSICFVFAGSPYQFYV